VAARDAHVLVQLRVAVDRGFLRRHDAVGERVQARDRHRQRLRAAQVLRAQVRHVGRRPHRVGDQPVERLDQRRRLAPRRIEGHRAAERDDRADALRVFVRRVHREHSAQAPADETHLAAAAMVQIADLLLQRRGVPVAEADVAPEAPGLHLVAAVLEEQLQHDHRALVGHESRQQQHRVAVAARRKAEQRQRPRQRRHLDEDPRLEQLVQQVGLADVAFSGGHREVVCACPAGSGATAPRRVPVADDRMPQWPWRHRVTAVDVDRRQTRRYDCRSAGRSQ